MNNHQKGIFLILTGVVILSIMDALVKWLVIHGTTVILILAVRGWMILSAFFIFMRISHKKQKRFFHRLETQQPGLHLIRAVIGFFAPFLFFTSLQFIPLAEATAIFFCTTFFMTAGSIPMLGESVEIPRWIAITLGFIGVLLITQPGSDGYHIASLLALGSGASYAFLVLSGRLLSRSDSTFSLVFYFNLAYTVIASALLPFFWEMPSLSVIGLILLVSIMATIGHFSLTNAFALAPVAIIAPYEYTALIWSVLLGYLIWNDLPTVSSWVGILLITLSGLFIVWRENRVKQPFM